MTTKTAEIPLETVEIRLLTPSKTNPRKRFDEHALNELAESIKKQGIVQPILVRPKGSGFEIVAGERRYRAAVLAGLDEVPVICRELEDKDVLEIQVIENLQRMDLHPLEEAEGYRQLLALKGYDAAKIGAQVGRSAKYVYDRIKLLNLIEPLRKVFFDGKITAGHAILLARLSKADQNQAMDRDAEALWTREYTLFGPNASEDEREEDHVKPRSVRELQAWIDRNVKFDASKVDPMLFPETAATLKSNKERAEAVVSITTDFTVDPAHRDGSKIYGPRSWERADGKQGSETCDHSVMGVFVIGAGRGDTLKVCIAKDKCRVHWGHLIRQRTEREKAKAKGPTAAEKVRAEQEKRQKAEQERRELESKRWKKATPALLAALLGAVQKAPTNGSSLLAQIVIEECLPYGEKKGPMPEVKTAEDVVRKAAFIILQAELTEWDAPTKFPKRLRAFGIDAKKILDEAAPVSAEEKPKPAEKAKK